MQQQGLNRRVQPPLHRGPYESNTPTHPDVVQPDALPKSIMAPNANYDLHKAQTHTAPSPQPLTHLGPDANEWILSA